MTKTTKAQRALLTQGSEAGQGPIEAASPAESNVPKGKLGLLVDLLSRPDGAAIDELSAATGWQAHSVRGAISGSIKKKFGLSIVSDKTEGGRRYRIEQAGAA